MSPPVSRPDRPVVSASAVIDAPAGRLYGILADYHHGHPAILPRPPFVSLAVEEGGRGDGTVIRVEMKMLGRRSSYRARVTEPEPGRVLVETNDTGFVTTFAVAPLDAGRSARVSISTVRTGPRSLVRTLESRLVAILLRPVYRRELQLLAEVAGTPPFNGEGDPA